MKKLMTRYLPRLLPILLALVLVLVGCSQYQPAPTAPTTPQPTPTQPPAPTVTTPPGIKIVQPTIGASLQPGNIAVTVEVSNFELVAPGGAAAAGKGHIHYYLDVAIPTTPGQGAFSAPGTYKASNTTSVTWENVAAGSHTLGVQLVNNDHTPLSPPVTAEMTVTVAAAAPAATSTPTIKIVQPAAGASLQAGSITVMVEVSNFELVAPGGAAAAGKGHIHYYLDTSIPTAPGQGAFSAPGTYKASNSTSVTWENIVGGTHTFGVQLVNNDHTPLSPPVTAEITIVIGTPPPPPPAGGGGIYGY